jgi:predicted DCC family thiol-disulfide oxidoreductase YuxK
VAADLPAPAAAPAILVYDGECPVCSAYVRYLRLKASAGTAQLINARDGGPWVDRVRAHGLDLDEGMALYYGGAWYHGADCIHMLALLSTPSSVFNRLNAVMFRSPRIARAMYPVLRAGRNLLLKVLGRSPLHLS